MERIVVRITINEATKILMKHFEREYESAVMIDWMPHELNNQVRL